MLASPSSFGCCQVCASHGRPCPRVRKRPSSRFNGRASVSPAAEASSPRPPLGKGAVRVDRPEPGRRTRRPSCLAQPTPENSPLSPPPFAAESHSAGAGNPSPPDGGGGGGARAPKRTQRATRSQARQERHGALGLPLPAPLLPRLRLRPALRLLAASSCTSPAGPRLFLPGAGEAESEADHEQQQKPPPPGGEKKKSLLAFFPFPVAETWVSRPGSPAGQLRFSRAPSRSAEASLEQVLACAALTNPC